MDAKYVPFAKETAMCVDLAYEAMEADIEVEIARASGQTQDALIRLLGKLRSRRKVLSTFTERRSAAR